jgi:lipid II isoglutaminyl synthase (glutamine-hydrolysing)
MTPGGHRSLTVAVVYPDLLGTYGDGGNGLILARRASWRGIEADLIQATSDHALPAADIYCIGGGEDGPQVRAAESLLADGTILSAVEQGAVVLGVCAGYQILGNSFPDSADRPHPGLGLLDVVTHKGSGTRAVGELLASTGADAPRLADGRPLPQLTGFENHGGVTTLGPRARPLARVVTGVGNGGGDGTEGAWSNRVLGSYLHGPLLARNIELADLVLGWALASSDGKVGVTGPLDPVALVDLDDHHESALRAERLGATEGAGDSGWRGRLRSLRR